MQAAEVPIEVGRAEDGLHTEQRERSALSPAPSAVGARTESIPTSTLTEDEAVSLARQLQVFSSPRRLRLLWELLDGEKRVGELAQRAGMSPSLTSFQLRVMREAGLTVARRQGTRAYYRLHDTNLRDLLVAIRAQHVVSKVSALADAAIAGEAGPLIKVADHRPRGDR